MAPKANLARKKIWRQIFSGTEIELFFRFSLLGMHLTEDMKNLILTLKLLVVQRKDGQAHFFTSLAVSEKKEKIK